MPGFLTSDVVVTDTEALYNCCASNVIAIADLETFTRVEYIDEKPSFLRSLLHLKAGFSNLLEASNRFEKPAFRCSRLRRKLGFSSMYSTRVNVSRSAIAMTLLAQQL